MENNQPQDAWFAHQLEPWFPAFEIVARAAQRDHLAAISLLGLPKKTERANDFHRSFRTHFIELCDQVGTLMDIVEGPDGEGLDYLTCHMCPDQPFGVRWGKYGAGHIRRNRTERSHVIQSQGHLFEDALGEMLEVLPMVSLGYELADDYTLAGRPCWWMNRIVLLREGLSKAHFITEVALLEQPHQDEAMPEDLAPYIEAREHDRVALAHVVQQILGDAA